MSEEAVVDEVVEETPVETEQAVEEQVEYSEAEQDAMSQGWSPEGVEGKRSLSAEEFLDRKPLYDKMHKMDKRIKEQEKRFDAMQKHETMVRERMHADHVKELQVSQKAAMEDMDYDKATAISEEIAEAKVDHAKAENAAPAPQEQIESTLEAWVEKNDWYNKDEFLQRQAEKEGKVFRMENPNASFDDVLDHISKTVKKEFPEKFQNMNRQQPSSVEGSATGGKRTAKVEKKKTVKDLPEEAIPVMNVLTRSGGPFKSKQDYVDNYFNQDK